MGNEQTEQLIVSTARLFPPYDADLVRIADALVGQGVPRLEAHMTAGYIQCAFGWVLLKSMGVKEFPKEFVVEGPDGVFTVPVEKQAVFQAALAVAEEVVASGYTEEINKFVFMAVATSSAEARAVLQALENGEDISDLRIVSSTMYGFSREDFGLPPKRWWEFLR